MEQERKNVLQLLVVEKMTREGLSDREAGRQAGVSYGTISAIKAGEVVGLDVTKRIVTWLGVSLSYALNGLVPGDTTLAQKVSLLLEAYPQLNQVFSVVIERVEAGTTDIRTAVDVLRYTLWVLDTSTRSDNGDRSVDAKTPTVPSGTATGEGDSRGNPRTMGEESGSV